MTRHDVSDDQTCHQCWPGMMSALMQKLFTRAQRLYHYNVDQCKHNETNTSSGNLFLSSGSSFTKLYIHLKKYILHWSKFSLPLVPFKKFEYFWQLFFQHGSCCDCQTICSKRHTCTYFTPTAKNVYQKSTSFSHPMLLSPCPTAHQMLSLTSWSLYQETNHYMGCHLDLETTAATLDYTTLPVCGSTWLPLTN